MTLTHVEKAILHLGRFDYYNYVKEYEAPFGVTQDGIAIALHTSRAHVSLILKGLREKHLVLQEKAHLRGSPTRRNVYFLTNEGKEKHYFVNQKMIEEGLSIDFLFSENVPEARTNPSIEKAYELTLNACTELAAIKDCRKPDTAIIMDLLLDAVRQLANWNANLVNGIHYETRYKYLHVKEKTEEKP